MLYLQLGYVLNRTVVLDSPVELSIEECCQPIGTFTADDIAQFPATKASFEIEQRDKVVRFDFEAFWQNKRLRRWFYPWVPPEFASLKCGRLIFDGECLSRLKLAEASCRRVDEEKASIGFDQPVIGFHVGPGSNVTDTPDAPLSMLWEQVEAIRQKEGVNRVLITGGSKDMVAGLPKDSGYEFLAVGAGDNASAVPQRASGELAAPATQKQSDHEMIVADHCELELLAACDWVVGRYNAEAPRLAAARIGARMLRCDRHRLVVQQPERKGLRRLLARK